MRIVFVQGAFSRDGAWWWAPVAERLDVPSEAVALPSCGEAGIAPTGDGPGLAEDAAALTAVLDAGGPAILVAHSYGGMVATEAGDHPAVREIVYVTSFLPAPGETLGELSAGPDPVPVVGHEDGSVSVDTGDRETFDTRFLYDVTDPDLVRGAHERLCPQSAAVFGAPATRAAWRSKPSTYLVCADEHSTDPALQRRQAARATTVHELPVGHFPFLSHPDLIAERIRAVDGA